jgi:hypothetical protein
MTVDTVAEATLPQPMPAPPRSPFERHPRTEYWDVTSACWVCCDEAAASIPEPRRGN